MKSRWILNLPGSVIRVILCLVLCLVFCGVFCSPAAALSGGMQKAVVHAMHKVPCAGGQGSASHKGILADLAGVGGSANECIEYQLLTDKVTYVIRPRVAILLMLGDDVYIKLAGDQLLLHTAQAPTDIHCSVLSMRLRGDEDGEGRDERHQARLCFSDDGAETPCPEQSADFR